VLAGDTLRAAADLGVPMVAVTLIDRKGYFHQRLDEGGTQSESQSTWHPEHTLEPASVRVSITVEGRPVAVRAWRYSVRGIEGHIVPVFLLDTDIPGNSSWDRTLTDHLYGGDDRYRLCQEVVLGIGGVEILRGLGYGGDITYHLNEGHASLLALALL
jgi:starch phosphorylase